MKCIILSQGPVPTPEQEKVEGGGLRCWGLAQGLRANDKELDITVAYNEAYYNKDTFTGRYKDVDVITWGNGNIKEILTGFDTVVVSYCMGDLSMIVADSIRPDQQLILDCYVPIYIEVSARQSNELDLEYAAFHHDVPRWAHVLRRGDVFICASEPQKKFYEGVLAGLGRINPATYGSELIIIVPYGIYREKPIQDAHPIQNLIGKDHKEYKKILWFGGIYPWFDLRDLIEAVRTINEKTPTKLVIVGARNPFNTHPDFIKKYYDLLAYIKDNKLESIVLIQDWVSFDSRANWYLDSDLVVVINKLGQENSLAWRTRLVDFTWANLPIITNGGDPVSEILIKAGAASQFTGLDSKTMASDMLALLSDSNSLENMKKQLAKTRNYFYWDKATTELADVIAKHIRPVDFMRYGFYDLLSSHSGMKSKAMKLAFIIRKIPSYTAKYGKRNTLNTAHTMISRKVHHYLPSKNASTPRVVIVSHQLDMSGAPFVIMDVAGSLKKSYPNLPIDFYTYNPAHHKNIVALNEKGIRPKILSDRNATINFHRGDVVVLNTVAHSDNLKWDIYSKLNQGYLSKLIWYVHEDEPELIFNQTDTQQIKSLLDTGKIEILTAAIKTRDHYRAYFNNKTRINIQNYQVVIPEKYHRKLKAKDFKNKLSFILPGTIGDGRKGQMPLFYAFADFKRNVYDKNPKMYRNFELVYVGVDNDFLSRQIIKQAKRSLGAHFSSYGRVDKDEVLNIIAQSNVTVCYSIRECLPLFVFEGMIMGHPILRNDSSGIDEQLKDGQNGYYLDSNDNNQVRDVIEKVLNKKKTTDIELEKMSSSSYGIAKEQENNDYSKILDIIKEAFDK